MYKKTDTELQYQVHFIYHKKVYHCINSTPNFPPLYTTDIFTDIVNQLSRCFYVCNCFCVFIFCLYPTSCCSHSLTQLSVNILTCQSVQLKDCCDYQFLLFSVLVSSENVFCPIWDKEIELHRIIALTHVSL